jgi:hypothetical protein
MGLFLITLYQLQYLYASHRLRCEDDYELRIWDISEVAVTYFMTLSLNLPVETESKRKPTRFPQKK